MIVQSKNWRRRKKSFPKHLNKAVSLITKLQSNLNKTNFINLSKLMKGGEKMAKKNTKSKVVVTPNPKDVEEGVCFDDLDRGDCFIKNGMLCQKLDEYETEQGAVDLTTGDMYANLCKETVIPVTVTITWEVK